MTKYPIAPQEEPPIWKGRRGLINTGAVVVLAILLGFGLWFLADRTTITPACTAYADAHGMTYKDFKLVGLKRDSTVVCLLARANGTTKDVYLKELVPVYKDYLVSFAMSIEYHDTGARHPAGDRAGLVVSAGTRVGRTIARGGKGPRGLRCRCATSWRRPAANLAGPIH